MTEETISYKKWDKQTQPERILIIRFHAIGDVSLTIPASNSLRKLFPSARIDFLTGELSAPLLNTTDIFDNIYSFKDYSQLTYAGDSFNVRMDKWREASKWGWLLKENKYEVIIDLQRNHTSKILRFIIRTEYFSEFDRFGPLSAAQRTLNSFHLAGFDNVINDCDIKIKSRLLERTKKLLTENSWNGSSKLIVLNPAGLWVTRNWPLQNYAGLAKLILKSEDVKFLLIGDDRITEKAKFLKESLGDALIDLTGKTSLDEAFALFKFVTATVTEDSALLHFSWVSGVPTIALLGSTRSDWTSPMPPHGSSFNSSDLECGDCMLSTCKFGDVHCLTRVTPEMVYERLTTLMNVNKGS